jgi:hypothetical protein
MAALAAPVAILTVLSGTSPLAEAGGGGSGPSLQPPFTTDYTFTNVGTLPNTQDFIGSILVSPDDPDTLIFGTSDLDENGMLNTIAVVRDADGHITGFSGSATFLANADGNDGGADFAPNGTLFVSTYPDGKVLQFKPGSTDPDKVVDLTTIGVTGSTGALRFVPAGFEGAGQLKIIDYSDDAWYTVPITEDGTGTYDFGTASLDAQFATGTGPESAVYVSSSHQFSQDSILLAEFDPGEIAAYTIDSAGNPLPPTRRTFIAGEDFAPAGMVRDLVTGDLVISDYYGVGVYVIQGFVQDPVKGDLNCDGSVNASDAVVSILYAAGVPLDGPDDCPAIGEGYPNISIASADNIVGDMNCDNQVDIDDTLTILRHLGDLPTGINTPSCKPIGSD